MARPLILSYSFMGKRRNIMSEELKLLDEWTERLGLKDWFIVLETNCKPENMLLQDADGCVSYAETTKSAKISMINKELRSRDSLRPFSFEETLVHELLHLKFCLLEEGEDWDNTLQLRLLHTVIDDIARALIDTKNFKEKKRRETKKEESKELIRCKNCEHRHSLTGTCTNIDGACFQSYVADDFFCADSVRRSNDG